MSDYATLRDAIIYLSDSRHCKQFMIDGRWSGRRSEVPDMGISKTTYVVWHVWKCYSKHLSATSFPKIGATFNDSPIGLEKWLLAAWMLVNCKNNVSSWEVIVHWFTLQRIRLATGTRPKTR